jgi:Tetratricopeptide repeat
MLRFIKNIIIVLALLALTTALVVVTFRWTHQDFFYVQSVFTEPGPDDREPLLAIYKKGYHRDQRHTALSMMLSEALIRIGEPQKAASVVSWQVELNRADIGILKAYADHLTADGRYDEAERILTDLLNRKDAQPPVTKDKETE